MKIVFFTRYTRKGASSRLRFYQYLPIFEANGFQCQVNPLFGEKYLNDLYSTGRVSKLHVFWRYLLQLIKLINCYQYNILVIEKELLPFLPAVFERLLALFRIKYIVDYDDAIFHNYDLHPNKLVKRLLSDKIAHVIKFSVAVVAGNDYLNNYAVNSGAKRTVLIPTVVDTNKYFVKQVYHKEEVIIGWIGSPSTLKYVEILRPVLQEISKTYSIKLHIVGGKAGVGLVNIENVLEWSEVNEVEMIRQFDIGIMPLKDELWEYGKCGYKLIQYMACGIPVIGSPIGVNDTIIQEGINGFKPTDLIGWKNALLKLIEDDALRVEMGKHGREIVEAKYSLKRASNEWLHLLRDTLR